jgi:hypothetical protein
MLFQLVCTRLSFLMYLNLHLFISYWCSRLFQRHIFLNCFVSGDTRPMPSQGVDTPGGNDQSVKEGKIRVRVFMELSSLVHKQSVSGEGSSAFDNTMNISSRRSHLALQLGVWTALQHLVPLVHSNENGTAALFSKNDVGLLNALMASS